MTTFSRHPREDAAVMPWRNALAVTCIAEGDGAELLIFDVRPRD
jgi:hypothetical protein